MNVVVNVLPAFKFFFKFNFQAVFFLKLFPYWNLVQCFIITIEYEFILMVVLLLLFFSIAEWNCQQLAVNNIKTLLDVRDGNKLLIYVTWNSCHSILVYAQLYTSHTHIVNCYTMICDVLWCVLSLTILRNDCERNVNIQLPATNRCLYVARTFVVFLNVVVFFLFKQDCVYDYGWVTFREQVDVLKKCTVFFDHSRTKLRLNGKCESRIHALCDDEMRRRRRKRRRKPERTRTLLVEKDRSEKECIFQM